MRNRIVVAASLTALLGLTVGAQVACQSMKTPEKEMMEVMESNCRDAVLNRLQGSSPDKIDIVEGDPLMQGGFVVMDWQATDRLAKGQCLAHPEDGSLARFVQFKE